MWSWPERCSDPGGLGRIRAFPYVWSPQVGLTFDRFFELSPSFMLVVDLDGRIVAINGALLEALGQGEAELRGRSIAELLHPDDVEASAMARRQAGSGGKVIDAERRMRRRDGTYLLTSWRATAEDGLIYSVGVD